LIYDGSKGAEESTGGIETIGEEDIIGQGIANGTQGGTV